MSKVITIALYHRDFVSDWTYNVEAATIADLAEEISAELADAGVAVRFSREEDISVEIKGYGDILNSIRLRSSEGGNPCLGHVIGESPECDLPEDIRRGVKRLAFAPETIVPDAEHRKTCHNCGCGC
ncbi:MAG: hypothetical protein C0623_12140 [Desulfuromonas sp.]|nr:MAG: hypothetical protein C0623_12140 [Desulfuromonas sp.]